MDNLQMKETHNGDTDHLHIDMNYNLYEYFQDINYTWVISQEVVGNLSDIWFYTPFWASNIINVN